jgi:hypothetical protein
LLPLDLGNTLIDRAGAFRRWAQHHFADLDGTGDADGYAPTAEVAVAVSERVGLADGTSAIVDSLLTASWPRCVWNRVSPPHFRLAVGSSR